jgi:hypothetical protein
MQKDTKALMQYVKRTAKKRKWQYKIYVAGSEHSTKKGATKWAQPDYLDGKQARGRVKINIYEPKTTTSKVSPHLHFIIKANPAETVMQSMRGYWQGKQGKNTLFYQRGDSGYVRYMWEQSSFDRFDGYDPDGEIDCDFKDMVHELQSERVAVCTI